MASDEVLEIIQSETDIDSTTTDDPVIIDDIFQNVPNERFDDAFGRFSGLNLSPIAGIPLYDMLWPRFATSFNTYHTFPQGLSHIVVLYMELENELNSRNVTRIECVGVDTYYLSAIADLVENEGLRLVSDTEIPKRRRADGFLRGFARLLVVFIDTIFSLFLKPLFARVQTETDVVFVPHLNRFGSMKSVIERANFDYKVIAPITTLDWYYSRATGKREEVAEFDPIPITYFSSAGVLIDELRTIIDLFVSELLFGQFKEEFVDAIEAEFGIRLNRSVDHSLGNTYRLHLSGIPNLFLAERMIKATECRRIVVGAQSLRQLSILIAARRNGILTFHVPHTIPLRHEPVPRMETVHFVPGPASAEYLVEASHIHDEGEVVPMGRPLFAALAKERQSISDLDDREELRVVIATQPYDDSVRKDFVSDIFEGLKRLDRPVSVVIKTHSGENPNFYSDIRGGERLTVSVTSTDLHEHLKWADLTFVINSNVGIESMVLGTPCVVVNEWNPKMFVKPGLRASAIPLLRTREEVIDFISGLDNSKLTALREDQLAYVDDNFVPSDDIAQEIVDYIAMN